MKSVKNEKKETKLYTFVTRLARGYIDDQRASSRSLLIPVFDHRSNSSKRSH